MKERNRCLVLFAMLTLIITVLACDVAPIPTADQVNVPPTDVPIPTPTDVPIPEQPRPTDRPTDSPTAIPTEPLATEPVDTPTEEPEAGGELKEEIYFSGGGGDGVYCHNVVPASGETLPAIRQFRSPTDEGSLCLFGFPLAPEITVELYTPDGSRFLYTFGLTEDGHVKLLWPVVEGSAGGYYGDMEGMSMIEIFAWWPVGLPAGDWYAVVSTFDTSVEGSFEVAYSYGPATSTRPDAPVNPFVPHHCDYYSAGDSVVIQGVNFEPGIDLSIGIYLQGGDYWSGKLVRGEVAPIDAQGGFSVTFPVLASDSPGTYIVVPMIDPDVDTFDLMMDDSVACYKVP